MDLRFKTNILEHIKVISGWAQKHDAKAFVDATTGALAVQRGQRAMRFEPQFVGVLSTGSLAYFPELGAQCNGFVAWLPYPVQTWPISSSKLAFKRIAAELGIRTPPHWIHGANATSAYIVKPERSAFGYGIHGPYLPIYDGGMPVQCRDGEFAEAFKTGRIARAWYWAGKLTVLEMFDMPMLRGDGRSTFADLIGHAMNDSQTLPGGSDNLAKVQGLDWEQIVPTGSNVIGDYRYVSPLNPTVYANNNRLQELVGSRVADQFVAAGHALWPQLPGSIDHSMAFVLDAIVDADDTAWFLEVNSNAQMHPDIYPFMLNELLEEGSSG